MLTSSGCYPRDEKLCLPAPPPIGAASTAGHAFLLSLVMGQSLFLNGLAKVTDGGKDWGGRAMTHASVSFARLL